jgi:uncharacterized membrane protein
MIAFLPFITNIIGEHGYVPLVVALYALNVAVLSGLEVVMLSVAHRNGLIERPLPPDVYRYAVLQSSVPVVIFLASIPLAWIHVVVAYACWATNLAVGPVLARRRPADADAYLP